jgi:hypothetical protein
MMKLLLSYCVVAVVALFLASPALADGAGARLGAGASKSELFTQTDKMVDNAFTQGEKIVYGVGGLGAIALGALAFFGRFQWGWFFGLIGGLALIASISLIISYITGIDDTYAGATN